MTKSMIWKQQRKLAGGCVMCKDKAVPGMTLCQKHREQQSARRKDWRDPFSPRCQRHNLGIKWNCMACRLPSKADLCGYCTKVLRLGCEQRAKEAA